MKYLIFLAFLTIVPARTRFESDAAASTPASVPASAPAIPVLLQNVLVIGASASAGFNYQSSTKHPMVRYVNAMVKGEHRPFHSKSSEMFFLSPDRTGSDQINEAETKKASLVIAVDYLFWFGYGLFKNEDDRLVLLARGLELLEMLECPMVISEIPDMTPAIGIMLAKEQVPQKETFVKLNTKIREWAATRKNVVLVNLPELLNRLRNGDEVEIRGNKWEKGSTQKLLQSDNLHPTPEGTAVLALLAMDALVKNRTEIPESSIEWDVKKILASAKLPITPPRKPRPASSPAK
ncbi:MAG: hypothetical protein ACKVS6_10405 [Planctomycetota bacterium]